MAIELNNVKSGYSTPLINDNFQKLQDEINNNVLRRDGLAAGEANQMNVPLDMNSNPILNVSIDPDDPTSLLTVGIGDSRYVNLAGDAMQGDLDMVTHPVFVRDPIEGNEPARKDQLDNVITNYQAADANLQAQISGGSPLEASAFSEISWHDQEVSNSVIIPENKNAWSIGPTMSIAPGQAVTVGLGSFWTIVEGALV